MFSWLFFISLISIDIFHSASAREIKACGHQDYPPWNWLKEGEITGVCADITRKVFERLGHKVNLSYVGPWKRCQMMVETGEVDVNICSFMNSEREAYSQFAKVPMGDNPIAVFVKKGYEFPFDKWSDLAGKRSGIVIGVSTGLEFDTFLSKQTSLEEASGPLSNLRKLSSDRLDFVPLGLEAGRLQAQLYGFEHTIVPLAHHALEGKLYISVSNKASNLINQIPEIEKYLSRPEYKDELEKTLDKYRNQYVEKQKQEAKKPVN